MHRILVPALFLLACSPVQQTALPAQPDAGPAEPSVAEAHGVSVRFVQAIEQQVVMPPGAQPLHEYNRFYVRRQLSDRDVVQGRFLLRRPYYPQRSGFALEGIPNAYATTEQSLPIVMDGGCTVVTVFFDVATMTLLPLAQEGMAGEDATGLAVCNGVA
jgi:hypothetical protein